MNTRSETTRGAEMESRPRAQSNGVSRGQVSRGWREVDRISRGSWGE